MTTISSWLQKREGILSALFVFVWPLLYFHGYLYPGSDIAIDNDFGVLYYAYKLYLLDMLAGGHFPLWSPAEAAGYPFYSNPFTQAFYPLNLPLTVYYKLMGGYTVYDHQVYSVLGVSIFALGLYFWLRLHTPNRRAVLYAVLVVSVSFKLGELLRFPNAVHAAAWIPWILYGVARARVSNKSRESGLILFGACLMLLTAGYPYYCYYCLFLVPPYVVLLSFKRTRLALLTADPIVPIPFKRYILTVSILALAASVICAPYYIKVLQLMDQTVGREGVNVSYASALGFDPLDTLGSFIFPPTAQAEGWFYFGMFGVLLLAAYTVLTLLGQSGFRKDRLFLVIVAGWFSVISLITYGESFYLFKLLYNLLPGFSSLRVWPRLNIVIVFLLALALARAYACFESAIFRDKKEGGARKFVLATGGLTAVIALGLQQWLYWTYNFDRHWLIFFKYRHGTEWWIFGLTVLACLLFVLICLLSRHERFRSTRSMYWTALLLGCAGAFDTWLYGGAEQWQKLNLGAPPRAEANILELVRGSLELPRQRKYATVTLPQANTGWLFFWYYKRYLELDQKVYDEFFEVRDPDMLPYYKKLMGIDGTGRILVSERVDHESIQGFIEDYENLISTVPVLMGIDEYDGDSLKVSIQTPRTIYLSFIDNWDPDWRAEVNGESVPIEQLLGTFKSVRVEPGLSTVRFSYRPYASFWGGGEK